MMEQVNGRAMIFALAVNIIIWLIWFWRLERVNFGFFFFRSLLFTGHELGCFHFTPILFILHGFFFVGWSSVFVMFFSSDNFFHFQERHWSLWNGNLPHYCIWSPTNIECDKYYRVEASDLEMLNHVKHIMILGSLQLFSFRHRLYSRSFVRLLFPHCNVFHRYIFFASFSLFCVHGMFLIWEFH